ncbi:RluA family pseudouridine synthase [Liquorilactobacillus satsumensis]|uniref:RluA family pseudouridine synthase n=1 Tax=Liquorilactobacillus satsumensis TaxID=259059 RepID=UPI0007049A13|nr:RluA family pseudouridine synthase [Liquorilactobacillus satsumensis]MCC7667057.1 RluA family pseudouridine synthase [Liquorilactobacillus satsumensis]MCP9311731.1 RluA family pseudouridine synthase [Liquorilactobacillus satsumensis]MCP9328469.1 RluA family pseudouridine synthase [Liquorilactobacillus satsumensis]MCP9357275.1 RluA family pseudouridine synthase [Liquorilactobacillus satsumensis]MCP9358864.1 RluA family pseudouridine synthase [Liquorilactobacillus satsumensis]
MNFVVEKRKIELTAGRVDKVAATLFSTYSRSQLKQWIIGGQLQVNGQTVKPNYQVHLGDELELTPPPIKQISLAPEKIPLEVVYEDPDVLVVNKPQGMVVHPSAGHPDHTLVNALLAHSPLSTINGEFRPGIVHRIDKDTSGLLMVAKNDFAHRSLAAQLKAKSNVREYLALVHGVIKEEKGTINAPLGRSPKDRKKQAVVADGRPAVTHFSVVRRYQNYTLIKCFLETGRTHQIRVHLKYIGHPLAGDPLYGPTKTLKGHGQFLHAGKLGFKHPRSGKQLLFEVPPPAIFKKILERLDKSDRN